MFGTLRKRTRRTCLWRAGLSLLGAIIILAATKGAIFQLAAGMGGMDITADPETYEGRPVILDAEYFLTNYVSHTTTTVYDSGKRSIATDGNSYIAFQSVPKEGEEYSTWYFYSIYAGKGKTDMLYEEMEESWEYLNDESGTVFPLEPVKAIGTWSRMESDMERYYTETLGEIEGDFTTAYPIGKDVWVGRKWTIYMSGTAAKIVQNHDLVWGYYFRRTGKNAVSQMRLYTADKKFVYISLSEEQTREALRYYGDKQPQMIVGYDAELERMYQKNFPAFLELKYNPAMKEAPEGAFLKIEKFGFSRLQTSHTFSADEFSIRNYNSLIAAVIAMLWFRFAGAWIAAVSCFSAIPTARMATYCFIRAVTLMEILLINHCNNCQKVRGFIACRTWEFADNQSKQFPKVGNNSHFVLLQSFSTMPGE